MTWRKWRHPGDNIIFEGRNAHVTQEAWGPQEGDIGIATNENTVIIHSDHLSEKSKFNSDLTNNRQYWMWHNEWYRACSTEQFPATLCLNNPVLDLKRLNNTKIEKLFWMHTHIIMSALMLRIYIGAGFSFKLTYIDLYRRDGLQLTSSTQPTMLSVCSTWSNSMILSRYRTRLTSRACDELAMGRADKGRTLSSKSPTRRLSVLNDREGTTTLQYDVKISVGNIGEISSPRQKKRNCIRYQTRGVSAEFDIRYRPK